MTERVIKPEKPGRAERPGSESFDRPARAERQPAAQAVAVEEVAPAEVEPAETVASTAGQPAEDAEPVAEVEPAEVEPAVEETESSTR